MLKFATLRALQNDHAGKTGACAGFCAFAALIATAASHADTAAVDEAAGPLQEITVTATRHEESLSKVPLSITALTQDAMDIRGIKDFQDIVRFTPGVNIDTSGTNNIAIRGIASSGGAGTTGIYIDDTPIQIRATAFNPDDALPKAFDIDRVEVLRGPQGTLFGSGSEGGTVRYITTQPSLTTNSFYGREEVSYTQSGSISYEGGIAAGGPLIDDKLGARLTVWYRRDGGYIDNINPVTLQTTQSNANYDETVLYRLAFIWAPADQWTVTPSIYYQDRYRNNVEDYWPLYSNPGNNQLVSADPDLRSDPDRFYLAAIKVEGNLGFAKLISNTSYYHRKEETGYEGTLYNLGFYQSAVFLNFNPDGSTSPASTPYPLLDGNGVHLPPGALDYRAPNSIDNHQQNITQEIRLQSNDADSKLFWTAGVFFSEDRQTYLEQIHDPLLNELSLAATGLPYSDWFVDPNGNRCRKAPPSQMIHIGCRPGRWTSNMPCSRRGLIPLPISTSSRWARAIHGRSSPMTRIPGARNYFCRRRRSMSARRRIPLRPRLAFHINTIRGTCTTPRTRRVFARAVPTIPFPKQPAHKTLRTSVLPSRPRRSTPIRSTASKWAPRTTSTIA